MKCYTKRRPKLQEVFLSHCRFSWVMNNRSYRTRGKRNHNLQKHWLLNRSICDTVSYRVFLSFGRGLLVILQIKSPKNAVMFTRISTVAWHTLHKWRFMPRAFCLSLDALTYCSPKTDKTRSAFVRPLRNMIPRAWGLALPITFPCCGSAFEVVLYQYHHKASYGKVTGWQCAPNDEIQSILLK